MEPQKGVFHQNLDPKNALQRTDKNMMSGWVRVNFNRVGTKDVVDLPNGRKKLVLHQYYITSFVWSTRLDHCGPIHTRILTQPHIYIHIHIRIHIYFHSGINREHHINFKIVLAPKIVAQHMDWSPISNCWPPNKQLVYSAALSNHRGCIFPW